MSEERIQLHVATESDLETLLRLESDCFGPRVLFGRQTLRYALKQRTTRILIAEGGAGYIIAHKTRGKLGEILALGVSSQARRRGVGRALATAAEEWLRAEGAVTAFLEVDEENRPACELYRSLGYYVGETFAEKGVKRQLMLKDLTKAERRERVTQ